MSLSFSNQHTSYHIPLSPRLREWFRKTIEEEQHTLGKVNVILLNDNELHQINLQYLAHDTLTDIITFDYNKETVVFGEIYISLDRVKDNARMNGISFEEEFHRILIHGLLHLLSYKDKNPEDKKVMTQKEDYYLSLARLSTLQRYFD